MFVSIKIYFTNFWNQIDLAASALLVGGLVLGNMDRQFGDINLYVAGRVLFAVATCIYIFRVLQFFVISKTLGPLVMMVYKTVSEELLF